MIKSAFSRLRKIGRLSYPFYNITRSGLENRHLDTVSDHRGTLRIIADCCKLPKAVGGPSPACPTSLRNRPSTPLSPCQ
jgi:hypothetical protein